MWLAIQIRKDNKELFEQLQKINNASVAKTVSIERTVLNLFEGGCHTPVGAYAEYDEDKEIYKLWVSKAAASDKLPIGIYLESKHAETMAEKAVSKIKAIKPTSVFITRNVKEAEYFYRILSGNGYKVSGKALIEMNQIPFVLIGKTYWIFFSSKHAVKFFFEQKPTIGNQKIGCIGRSTADAIRKYGHRADFIGYSTDTKMTAKQFASTVADGTVLFPMAKGSMRSIQNGFIKQNQVNDLIVYETIMKNDQPVPFNKIIVFTSPTNVDAYFEKNEFASGQKAVAMGEATANALKKYGVNYPLLPDGFNDLALTRAVFGI